jgi:copper chaperone CopZ
LPHVPPDKDVIMRPLTPNLIVAAVAACMFAAMGPWLFGQVLSLPGATPLAARSDQRIVALEVSGMTCNACVARIHDQLTTTPGVTACDVRLQQERAYVVCGRATADTTLVNAVLHAGPGYLAAVVKP